MRKLLTDLKILVLDGNKYVAQDGNILIEDNTIAYIGAEFPECDEKINLSGRLAMPGLINAHTHLGMSYLKNLADDRSLFSWLNDAVWPLEAKLSADDIYWASSLGMAEMIATGTTTFCDMYAEMDRVSEATVESGMRGVMTRGLLDIGGEQSGVERIENTKYLYKKYQNAGDGRVKFMIAPHSVYTCSRGYLERCLELSYELDLPVHIHMSETQKEVEDCLKEYGMTPVEYIVSLGYLKRHIVAAHCVHMTQKEIEMVAANTFFPVHNPTSNLKLASGIAPVEQMLGKGLHVALGTDSSASNNNLNMLEEVNLACLVGKVKNGNPEAVNASSALIMGTLHGARALCMDNITGTLEVGKRADIAIFNIDTPHMYPHNDLVAGAVYSMQGGDCERVYVDGKLLYKNGEFLTLDIERIKREAVTRLTKLKV